MRESEEEVKSFLIRVKKERLLTVGTKEKWLDWVGQCWQREREK